MSVRIKICGITNQRDAHHAAHCGASALGFNFYPQSKRYITFNKAAAIIATLPPFVTPVGLFVNASSQQIDEALALMPNLLLQFHGDENEQACTQFHRPYIKAVRVQSTDDVIHAEQTYPSVSALLLDAHVPNEFGGTGQPFDWTLIPKIQTPLIIAGGLQPSNVAQLLRLVRPFALDVSSGVERTPGKKDAQLMQSFFAEVVQ